MKIMVMTLAALAAWSAVECANAGPQAQGTAEAAQPIESVTVKARRFHLEPQQFADYEYAYVLDNHETVRFSRRVGRFYVALMGQPAVEIFASGPDKFETAGGTNLVFTEGGDVLTIDHFEALQAASTLQAAAKAKPKK